MSTDRLRDVLRNSTEHVDVVELTDAAMKQSRQMTVRRATVGATLAVVLLAGGILGAANFWPGSGDGGVDVAASGSPSASASAAPGPEVSTSGGGSVAPQPKVDGTLLYVTEGNGLIAWKPGSAPKTVIAEDKDGDALIYETANVSPDGRYIVWNTTGGKVRLHDIDTGKDRDVADTFPNNICSAPAWTPDGRILLSLNHEGNAGLFNPQTNKYTEVPFTVNGCQPRVVEQNGVLVVYFIDGGVSKLRGIELESGKVVLDVPNTAGSRKATDMSAVMISAGGKARFTMRTTTLTGPNGDGTRGFGGDSVFELRDGRLVDLNLDDSTLSAAYQAQDGAMVIRQKIGDKYKVSILNTATGASFDSRDEPASLKGASPLGYTFF